MYGTAPGISIKALNKCYMLLSTLNLLCSSIKPQGRQDLYRFPRRQVRGRQCYPDVITEEPEGPKGSVNMPATVLCCSPLASAWTGDTRVPL